jgi:uncharacterized protein (DUF427 family)
MEPARATVEVRVGDVVIARSDRAIRVCETASPPTYYLPPEDVAAGLLQLGYGRSVCEWKGDARYWSVVLDDPAGSVRVENAAWSYPEPWEGFEALAGWLAFYPARVHCTVGGESVRAQEGDFYGGWVTDEVVGPWKGAPGTGHW